MESGGTHQSLRMPGPPSRLDAWLSSQFPEHSRARWQELIKAGLVTVNAQVRKPSQEVREGDLIDIRIPPPVSVEVSPEAIPLNILYEDADLIVINKPPGLVVHPAPGHDSGTLVNALLHHCTDLKGIGGELRPGIVHRLDLDTSGTLVVAKNEQAMMHLAAQFKGRSVRKEYVALVWGRPRPPSGRIETLVGRNPHDRKKMSASPHSGKPAITNYETLGTFGDVSYLRVHIETGRTHQIRVHLAHIGHPVVGDRQYGGARRAQLPVPAERQMLHAERLAFQHPRTGLELEFVSPLPDDMKNLLAALKASVQNSRDDD